MSTRPYIQVQADYFVAQLLRLDPETRPEWIAYVLEAMESELGEEAVHEVHDLITERLGKGSW